MTDMIVGEKNAAKEFATETGLPEEKYFLALWLIDHLEVSRPMSVEVLKGSVSFDAILSDLLKKRGESLRKHFVMLGGGSTSV
jgi:hypothetical protein